MQAKSNRNSDEARFQAMMLALFNQIVKKWSASNISFKEKFIVKPLCSSILKKEKNNLKI
jgi:hypothetical protein